MNLLLGLLDMELAIRGLRWADAKVQRMGSAAWKR